jgi:uncharacterized membrane protein YhaH (DUF805 family)
LSTLTTFLPVQFLRISSFVLFVIGMFVAIATFKGFAGMSPTKQMGLWIMELLFPVICVAIYVASQVLLVLRTLDDRWPLGDIAFGCLAFIAACTLMFGFSNEICVGVKHYIDGTFFGALCMLFAVMMVYKYWDSITKEDLEFSVGSKQSVWEIKDPMMGAHDNDMMGPGSFSTHESYPRSNNSSKLTPTSATGSSAGKSGLGYPPSVPYSPY